MQDYKAFLAEKRPIVRAVGEMVDDGDIHERLFPFQRTLTRWAIRKGRAALFADTGLGKTLMQLEWARLIGERTLIVAPLSVARQTVREGRTIGLEVIYSRGGEVKGDLTITNYEMVEKFDPSLFGAIVLDESSILKGIDGKTRQCLTDMFGDMPYKLCCTATPAPNDITEIANHAEFLGIMSRADMLSSFFVHDSDSSAKAGWRLKGHAEEPFYRWLASWGMSVKKPSDLGFSDDGFILPPLNIESVWVESNYVPPGALFPTELKGIQHRSQVRRLTLEDRVKAAADLANEGDEQWILWCGLNDEGRMLHRLVPDSVLMEGSDSPEKKATAIEAFQDGKHRVLVSKGRIAGFGMNLQNCHNMAFVGMSDSWEMYYQCVRRCWRFGQEHPVTAHIVLSDAESAIYENVKRKEAEAEYMSGRLIENVRQFEQAEIAPSSEEWEYEMDDVKAKDYRLMLGDSTERMKELKTASVDLSVFSPPFFSLYTYSPTERDVGNSQDEETFFDHFGYIIDELMRVTKPGRLCAVHVSQVPATIIHDGYIGVKDFRGKTIVAFEKHGWIYHGEACIDKNPQVQAVRSHAKGLLFAQLHKDASWLHPAFADYILLFRQPKGENAVPVLPDISNEDWIKWAHPVWYDIKQSDTLNVVEARADKDERHITPMQLGTLERCIRLWSNPGEVVFSPFAGIGSAGYVALQHGRKYVGIELKKSYFEAAKKNLERAVSRAAGQSALWENTNGRTADKPTKRRTKKPQRSR